MLPVTIIQTIIKNKNPFVFIHQHVYSYPIKIDNKACGYITYDCDITKSMYEYMYEKNQRVLVIHLFELPE